MTEGADLDKPEEGDKVEWQGTWYGVVSMKSGTVQRLYKDGRHASVRACASKSTFRVPLKKLTVISKAG